MVYKKYILKQVSAEIANTVWVNETIQSAVAEIELEKIKTSYSSVLH